MIKDVFVSVILYLDEVLIEADIYDVVQDKLAILSSRCSHYELIIVSCRPETLRHDYVVDISNTFTNLSFIIPRSNIDEDVAFTLGLINSIGEKAICCFLDTSDEVLLSLMNRSSRTDILLRSLRDESVNVFLVHRDTINSLITAFGSTKITFLESLLMSLGFNYKVERHNIRPRNGGNKIRLIKKMRTLYNDYFIESIAIMLGIFLISKGLQLLVLGADIFAYRILQFFDLILLVLVVLIIAREIYTHRFGDKKINYKMYRSSFTFTRNLNIEK